MKEEKENLILKFFGFFVGPIQFVMEVSFITCCIRVLSLRLRIPFVLAVFLAHPRALACIQTFPLQSIIENRARKVVARPNQFGLIHSLVWALANGGTSNLN